MDRMAILSQDKSAIVVFGEATEIYEDQRYDLRKEKYEPTIYYDCGASELTALKIGTYNNHEEALAIIKDIFEAYIDGFDFYTMPPKNNIAFYDFDNEDNKDE